MRCACEDRASCSCPQNVLDVAYHRRKQPHTAAQHALWAIKHRPAWAHSGAFLTGMRMVEQARACTDRSCATGPCTSPVLRVLDFEFTAASGCYVKGEPCSHTDAVESCRSCARPLELSTSAPVVTVAAHPRSDDIVVGLQVRHCSAMLALVEGVLSALCFRREVTCRFLLRHRTVLARLTQHETAGDARVLARGLTSWT